MDATTPDLDPAADDELAPREAEPADPSLIRDPPPQPLFSWWRAGMAALLLLAVAAMVVAVRSADDTGGAGSARTGIASFQPTPGGRVLRQSEIGVVLEPGWDGRLTINGVPIPEDQMSGAIDPESEAWQNLTPEEQALGPRPNNKERVLFRPGEGKAITELDTGTVEVELRFWRIVDGPDSALTFPYTVNVT